MYVLFLLTIHAVHTCTLSVQCIRFYQSQTIGICKFKSCLIKTSIHYPHSETDFYNVIPIKPAIKTSFNTCAMFLEQFQSPFFWKTMSRRTMWRNVKKTLSRNVNVLLSLENNAKKTMSWNVKKNNVKKCEGNNVKQMPRKHCQKNNIKVLVSLENKQSYSPFLGFLLSFKWHLPFIDGLHDVDCDMVPSGTSCIQNSSCWAISRIDRIASWSCM